MTFSEKTETFLRWFLKNGSISDKVNVQDYREYGQGRALVAKKDIGVDEELFRVPRGALLNARNNLLLDKDATITEQLSKLPQWDALILVVLYEWLVKKDASPWAPYFAILPVTDRENYHFNQLVHWTDDEISALKPSFIVDRIGKDAAVETYNRVKTCARDMGITELGNVSEEEFHAAASLIMSYSFDVGGGPGAAEGGDGEASDGEAGDGEADSDENEEDPAHNQEDSDSDSDLVGKSSYLKSMVPLADTLNADTAKHNASLMLQKEDLVMRSIKEIKAGEQIYNSYSEHPNSELLRRYGYVEQQGSQYDFGEVSLGGIMEHFSRHGVSMKDLEKVVDILREIQDEEGEEFVLDSYDCYCGGEVIFEFIFLVQVLTVVVGVNVSSPIENASLDLLLRGITRIFKKTYQLLESGKVTNDFVSHYKAIIEGRLGEYSDDAAAEFTEIKPELSRGEMASVVKKSEYKALQSCLDTEKALRNGEQKYTTVEDERLLLNILKKDLFGERKRQKR